MPTFDSFDGTTLSATTLGTGDPLVVMPGGPMQASVYLGDLGGLDAHRTLHLLDLRGTGGSAVPADPARFRVFAGSRMSRRSGPRWAWTRSTCSATPPAQASRSCTPPGTTNGSAGWCW
jgi:pimeloyl-ACP methyl ester carboxylesterase